MNKYTGLIKCDECNHTFKGRMERNNINYRCNYRLKYGKDKCSNDSKIEESLIDNMIEQQLNVINYSIDDSDKDIKCLIDNILVSQDRLEIFFKGLPIKSCYIDTKIGKLHFDSIND